MSGGGDESFEVWRWPLRRQPLGDFRYGRIFSDCGCGAGLSIGVFAPGFERADINILDWIIAEGAACRPVSFAN
jgi:hypothetical protein